MSVSTVFKNFKKKHKGKWLKTFIYLVLAGFLLGVFSVAGVFIYFMKDLPDPGKINKRVIIESTKIYDRTGNHLLYEIHGEEKRTLIPFNQIPDSLKYATIVLEDRDFYNHFGLKPKAILRAVLKDLVSTSAAQGGSTITQQFVKNSILTPERTLTRKIKEAILSIEMEQKFTKDEILGMYLNEIPYGSNAYGIESASQTFFAKSAKELTLDEAALLACLPNAPTFYSPLGSHTDRLIVRQHYALDQMAEIGYITKQQAEEAKNVDVLSKIQPFSDNISAPHFVMYIREILEQQYGQQLIEQGGLKVYTTLDWDKHQLAEEVVKEGVAINAEKYNASNASLVAIDPKTGQILAMVGSKDYWDKSVDGQVNVSIRERQPGSSFKPYVYLTAFEKGYNPETYLYDVLTDFAPEEDKEYIPQNYDGQFHGPVHIKDALAMSLNIPAVKTLYLAGLKDSISMAKRLGINGLDDPNRYGLSLVLGGGEIKLLDHVHAYSTIANNGVKNNLTSILRIEDRDGQVLDEYKKTNGEQVVEEKYIAMLTHILSKNEYRAPAFGTHNDLNIPGRPVAAKTGTTNEYRDAWTIGYTPNITVGVWGGNNDNSPMKSGGGGSNVAAPIWNEYMTRVLENYPIEDFPKYDKDEALKNLDTWMLNGQLDQEEEIKVCEIPDKDDKYCKANKYCPEDDEKKRTVIDAHPILYYVNKDNPLRERPQNPKSDPQYNTWNDAIKEWYKNENKDKKKYILDEPPEECDKDDFEDYLPQIKFKKLSASGSQLTIETNTDAPYGVDSVKFYVDGNEIDSSGSSDAKTTYTLPESKNGSKLEVKIKIKDDNGNENEESDRINVSW